MAGLEESKRLAESLSNPPYLDQQVRKALEMRKRMTVVVAKHKVIYEDAMRAARIRDGRDTEECEKEDLLYLPKPIRFGDVHAIADNAMLLLTMSADDAAAAASNRSLRDRLYRTTSYTVDIKEEIMGVANDLIDRGAEIMEQYWRGGCTVITACRTKMNKLGIGKSTILPIILSGGTMALMLYVGAGPLAVFFTPVYGSMWPVSFISSFSPVFFSFYKKCLDPSKDKKWWRPLAELPLELGRIGATMGATALGGEVTIYFAGGIKSIVGTGLGNYAANALISATVSVATGKLYDIAVKSLLLYTTGDASTFMAAPQADPVLAEELRVQAIMARVDREIAATNLANSVKYGAGAWRTMGFYSQKLSSSSARFASDYSASLIGFSLTAGIGYLGIHNADTTSFRERLVHNAVDSILLSALVFPAAIDTAAWMMSKVWASELLDKVYTSTVPKNTREKLMDLVASRYYRMAIGIVSPIIRQTAQGVLKAEINSESMWDQIRLKAGEEGYSWGSPSVEKVVQEMNMRQGTELSADANLAISLLNKPGKFPTFMRKAAQSIEDANVHLAASRDAEARVEMWGMSKEQLMARYSSDPAWAASVARQGGGSKISTSADSFSAWAETDKISMEEQGRAQAIRQNVLTAEQKQKFEQVVNDNFESIKQNLEVMGYLQRTRNINPAVWAKYDRPFSPGLIRAVEALQQQPDHILRLREAKLTGSVMEINPKSSFDPFVMLNAKNTLREYLFDEGNRRLYDPKLHSGLVTAGSPDSAKKELSYMEFRQRCQEGHDYASAVMSGKIDGDGPITRTSPDQDISTTIIGRELVAVIEAEEAATRYDALDGIIDKYLVSGKRVFENPGDAAQRDFVEVDSVRHNDAQAPPSETELDDALNAIYGVYSQEATDLDKQEAMKMLPQDIQEMITTEKDFLSNNPGIRDTINGLNRATADLRQYKAYVEYFNRDKTPEGEMKKVMAMRRLKQEDTLYGGKAPDVAASAKYVTEQCRALKMLRENAPEVLDKNGNLVGRIPKEAYHLFTTDSLKNQKLELHEYMPIHPDHPRALTPEDTSEVAAARAAGISTGGDSAEKDADFYLRHESIRELLHKSFGTTPDPGSQKELSRQIEAVKFLEERDPNLLRQGGQTYDSLVPGEVLKMIEGNTYTRMAARKYMIPDVSSARKPTAYDNAMLAKIPYDLRKSAQFYADHAHCADLRDKAIQELQYKRDYEAHEARLKLFNGDMSELDKIPEIQVQNRWWSPSIETRVSQWRNSQHVVDMIRDNSTKFRNPPTTKALDALRVQQDAIMAMSQLTPDVLGPGGIYDEEVPLSVVAQVEAAIKASQAQATTTTPDVKKAADEQTAEAIKAAIPSYSDRVKTQLTRMKDTYKSGSDALGPVGDRFYMPTDPDVLAMTLGKGIVSETGGAFISESAFRDILRKRQLYEDQKRNEIVKLGTGQMAYIAVVTTLQAYYTGTQLRVLSALAKLLQFGYATSITNTLATTEANRLAHENPVMTGKIKKMANAQRDKLIASLKGLCTESPYADIRQRVDPSNGSISYVTTGSDGSAVDVPSYCGYIAPSAYFRRYAGTATVVASDAAFGLLATTMPHASIPILVGKQIANAAIRDNARKSIDALVDLINSGQCRVPGTRNLDSDSDYACNQYEKSLQWHCGVLNGLMGGLPSKCDDGLPVIGVNSISVALFNSPELRNMALSYLDRPTISNIIDKYEAPGETAPISAVVENPPEPVVAGSPPPDAAASTPSLPSSGNDTSSPSNSSDEAIAECLIGMCEIQAGQEAVMAAMTMAGSNDTASSLPAADSDADMERAVCTIISGQTRLLRNQTDEERLFNISMQEAQQHEALILQPDSHMQNVTVEQALDETWSKNVTAVPKTPADTMCFADYQNATIVEKALPSDTICFANARADGTCPAEHQNASTWSDSQPIPELPRPRVSNTAIPLLVPLNAASVSKMHAPAVLPVLPAKTSAPAQSPVAKPAENPFQSYIEEEARKKKIIEDQKQQQQDTRTAISWASDASLNSLTASGIATAQGYSALASDIAMVARVVNKTVRTTVSAIKIAMNLLPFLAPNQGISDLWEDRNSVYPFYYPQTDHSVSPETEESLRFQMKANFHDAMHRVIVSNGYMLPFAWI